MHAPRINTVKVTHGPSGEVVIVDNYRSYVKNTAMAMKVLRSRLWATKNGYPRPDPDKVIASYDLPDDITYPHDLDTMRL